MERVILCLGSNEGERAEWLAFARERLVALPQTRLIAQSAIRQTLPVDVPEPYRDRLFLNQILLLESGLSPLDFSRLMHGIEDAAGRIRGPVRNTPRTLDIDMIVFGERQMETPELTLPHPRAHERLFVLEPLAEILPDFRLPGKGDKTVTEIMNGLLEKEG